MRKFLTLVVPFFLMACSEGTNFNQIFVNKEQKNSADYARERAQYHFDRGEYEKAKGYAEKMYELNKNDEESAVLLSYIYLGLARVDIFDLAENLIDQTNSEKSEDKPEENSSAVAALDSLGAVIGLLDEDRLAMADDDNSVVVDGTTVKGVSDNPLFTDLDVTLPKGSAEAREANSQLLQNLNKAIKIICPFINDEAKILKSDSRTDEDSRHTTSNCPRSTYPHKLGAKTHFLWAFSHLTEAIAFNSLMSEMLEVLNKRGTVIGKNNGGATVVNAQEYVDALSEIVSLVNVILPTSPAKAADSMLTSVFNDLETASLGFSQIDGMPEDMTKSINESLAKLKSSSSTIGNTNQNGNAAALKDQLLGKLTTKIRDEMTKRDSEFSAEQKTKACGAYKSITTQKFDLCP